MPSRKLLLQAAVDVGVAAASPQQPLFRTQSNSGTFEGAVSFSAFVFTTVTVFLLYAVYLSYFCRPRRQDDAAAGAVGIAADAVARERAERMRRCVEAMPVVAYAATAEKERCAICLGEYEDGEELRVLVQCKHAFHKKCVDRWLVSYAVRCPLCRRVVMTPVAGGGGGGES